MCMCVYVCICVCVYDTKYMTRLIANSHVLDNI